MKIVKAMFAGGPSEPRSGTFTGEVWADSVLPAVDGTLINNIWFAPCARTYWHSHERGQILHVLHGSGLICSQGGPVHRLEVGDYVWVPPGEVHWHGGSATSSLLHTAISLGTTSWRGEVSEAEYGTAVQQ
jgi:quercetin dioxygenase-like cupin family protein